MVSRGLEPEVGPVLEALASALARLDQPDLSGLPPEQVRRARQMMFGPQGIRPEFVDYLRQRVSHYSNQKVELRDADPAEFAWLSKEWGARYLRLARSGGDQLLILGDTEPMVQFAPHASSAA